ncbi:MAG: DUF3048 domain-containing protein [Clostridiales Family XIII bacterium]|nr:DUF3048 domain-containing protein [Clostridiales Family XIII bacterium]
MKYSNMKKGLAAVLVLVMIVALPLGGCGKKEEPKVELPVVPEAPPEPAGHEVYYWPYTGLTTTGAVAVKTRPLSVKIENSSQARPQTGLNSADVVYETMVEGMESRFNCIFQSNIPEEVGPVRSARLSDLWVVPQYQGILFFSGANKQVIGRLRSDKINLMSYDSATKLYHRVDFRHAPHNLYLELGGAYELAQKKDIKTESDTLSSLYFGQTGPAISTTSEAIDGTAGVVNTDLEFEGLINSADTVESVTVPFIHDAIWRWDAEKKVFLRWTGKEVHKDAATDEQLWTDNVVIMWADYPQQSMKDPAGAPTYDTELGKGGKAALFRDGHMVDCTWKADRTSTPTLISQSGSEIPLKAGRTWFIVPRTGTEIKIEKPKAEDAGTSEAALK